MKKKFKIFNLLKSKYVIGTSAIVLSASSIIAASSIVASNNDPMQVQSRRLAEKAKTITTGPSRPVESVIDVSAYDGVGGSTKGPQQFLNEPYVNKSGLAKFLSENWENIIAPIDKLKFVVVTAQNKKVYFDKDNDIWIDLKKTRNSINVKEGTIDLWIHFNRYQNGNTIINQPRDVSIKLTGLSTDLPLLLKDGITQDEVLDPELGLNNYTTYYKFNLENNNDPSFYPSENFYLDDTYSSNDKWIKMGYTNFIDYQKSPSWNRGYETFHYYQSFTNSPNYFKDANANSSNNWTGEVDKVFETPWTFINGIVSYSWNKYRFPMKGKTLPRTVRINNLEEIKFNTLFPNYTHDDQQYTVQSFYRKFANDKEFRDQVHDFIQHEYTGKYLGSQQIANASVNYFSPTDIEISTDPNHPNCIILNVTYNNIEEYKIDVPTKAKFYLNLDTEKATPELEINSLYPSADPVDVILKNLEEESKDTTKYKTFNDQLYTQSFVNVKNYLFSNTRATLKNHVVSNNGNVTNLQLTFVFSNWPQEDGTNGNKEVTFNYQIIDTKHQTSMNDNIYVNYSDNLKFKNITVNNASILLPVVDIDGLKPLIIDNIINKPEDTTNKLSSNDLTLTIKNLYDNSVELEVKSSKSWKFNTNTNKYEIVTDTANPVLLGTTIIHFPMLYGGPTSISRNSSYYDFAKNKKPEDVANAIRSNNYSQIGGSKYNFIKQMIYVNNYQFVNNKNELVPNYESALNELNVEVKEANNRTGSLSLTFTIPYAYSGKVEENCFSTKKFDLDFNFFESNQISTQVYNEFDIYDQLLATLTAKEGYEILKNSNHVKYTQLTKLIKDKLVSDAIRFTPDGFSAANINNIKPLSYSLADKRLNIEFELNNYYDDKGIKQTTPKKFTTIIHANFRSIISTKIVDNVVVNIPNQSNTPANEWYDRNGNQKLIDELYAKFEAEKQSVPNNPYISGDIPDDFNKSNILVKSVQEIDRRRGRIIVEMSLNKYWDSASNEVINNPEGYEPTTLVTFTGFASEGETILPIDGSVYDVSKIYGDKKASEVDKQNSGITSNDIKTLILNGKDGVGPIITGTVRDLKPSDISELGSYNFSGIDYVATPNDKDGTLSIQGKISKLWYDNPNTEDFDPTLGTPPESSGVKTTFNITLTGFKKVEPNTYNLNIDASTLDSMKNKLPSDISESTITSEINNNVFLGTRIEPINDTWKYKRDADNQKVIIKNNLDGTIKATIVINQYYDESNGLINNQSPIEKDITFSNLKDVEPTKFIDENELQIDNPALTSLDAQYLENLIKNFNPNSPHFLVEELKKEILNYAITGTKENIKNSDIELSAVSHDNLAGTLRISIKLNAYWDSKGIFVNKDTQGFTPITKEITLKIFNITGTTKVTNNLRVNIAPEASLSKLTPDNFIKLIISKPDTGVVAKTKELIFKNAVSGYTQKIDSNAIILTSASKKSDQNNNDEVIIKFKLAKYWDDKGDLINTPSKEYTISFFGFKTIENTSIITNQRLPELFTNDIQETFEQKYQITRRTVQQWVNLVNKNNNNEINSDTVKNLLVDAVFYNQQRVMNFPSRNLQKSDIVIENIKSDDKKGTISCNITVKKSFNNGVDGNNPVSGNLVFSGFLIVGETILLSDSQEVEIQGDLKTFVDTNRIDTGKIRFKGGKVTEPEGLDPLLRTFIRKHLISGYAPEFSDNEFDNITVDDVVILDLHADDIQKSTGKITLSYTLKKYYNQDGTLTFEDHEPATVVLTKFVLKQEKPTTFEKNTAVIQDFTENESGQTNNFFGPKNNANYDASIFKDTNPLYSEAIRNLKMFILSEVVTGNKIGLGNGDQQDGVDLSITNINIETGTIDVSYRLKKYWNENGYLVQNESSNRHTVTISGFKINKKTTFIESVHSLIDQNENTKLPSYEFDVDDPKIYSAEKLRQEIRETTLEEFIKSDNQEKIENLKYYIKKYIELNINSFYSDLPPDIHEYKYGSDFEIVEASQDRIDKGYYHIGIKLYTYIDEKGELVFRNKSKALGPNYTYFSGFKRTIKPEVKITNAELDISKNASPNISGTKANFYYELYSSAINENDTKLDYYWKNSYANTVQDDLVDNLNVTEEKAQKIYNNTISQWALDNLVTITGILDLGDVEIRNEEQFKLSGQIKLQVVFKNLGVNADKEQSVDLLIKGFKKTEIDLSTDEIFNIWILAGVGLGVLIVLIIILIILFKFRRDVEYRQ